MQGTVVHVAGSATFSGCPQEHGASKQYTVTQKQVHNVEPTSWAGRKLLWNKQAYVLGRKTMCVLLPMVAYIAKECGDASLCPWYRAESSLSTYIVLGLIRS